MLQMQRKAKTMRNAATGRGSSFVSHQPPPALALEQEDQACKNGASHHDSRRSATWRSPRRSGSVGVCEGEHKCCGRGEPKHRQGVSGTALGGRKRKKASPSAGVGRRTPPPRLDSTGVPGHRPRPMFVPRERDPPAGFQQPDQGDQLQPLRLLRRPYRRRTARLRPLYRREDQRRTHHRHAARDRAHHRCRGPVRLRPGLRTPGRKLAEC